MVGVQVGQNGDLFSSAYILILSPNCLQKQLLVSALNQVPGWSCLCSASLAKLSLPKSIPPAGSIVLIDCGQFHASRILAQLRGEWKSYLEEHFVALFNLSEDVPLEVQALGLGVRGFFYEKTRLSLLKKGISALLKQELWVSRKKLTACVHRGAKSVDPRLVSGDTSSEALTTREREVLGLMASGASNAEIAQELFISMHTVRTHNYNIFKKIKVSNRVEASLWCSKYF